MQLFIHWYLEERKDKSCSQLYTTPSIWLSLCHLFFWTWFVPQAKLDAGIKDYSAIRDKDTSKETRTNRSLPHVCVWWANHVNKFLSPPACLLPKCHCTVWNIFILSKPFFMSKKHEKVFKTDCCDLHERHNECQLDWLTHLLLGGVFSSPCN